VENLVANSGTLGKAMRDAGYSEVSSLTPQKLTESKGFKELCEEYGLTDQLLLTALVEDIKAKPQNRKGELELGAKIKGLLKDDKQEVEIKINLVDYGDYNPVQLQSKTTSTGVSESITEV
jgi:hypothetical protein